MGEERVLLSAICCYLLFPICYLLVVTYYLLYLRVVDGAVLMWSLLLCHERAITLWAAMHRAPICVNAVCKPRSNVLVHRNLINFEAVRWCLFVSLFDVIGVHCGVVEVHSDVCSRQR